MKLQKKLKNPSTYSSIDTDENVIQLQNSKLFKNQTISNIKFSTPKLEKYTVLSSTHINKNEPYTR